MRGMTEPGLRPAPVLILGLALLLPVLGACDGERDALREEVARLGAELQSQRMINESLQQDIEAQEQAHLAREMDWLGYTQVLASLPIPDAPAPPTFVIVADPRDEPGAETPAPSLEELEAEAELRRVREEDEAICAELAVLLRAEGVWGMVFLTIGTAGEGFSGPVVVRLIDDRGRPVGNLHAARFHLEASHAGQSVTLVFEDGGESHGGRPAVAFDGGSRRVPLVGVDPAPWLEALPGLFAAVDLEGPRAEPGYDLARRVRALNELLLADTSAGFWRLRSCRRVAGRVFQETQLEHRNRSGRVDKRLFADRLSVEAADHQGDRGGGVVLRLAEGVQDVGGEMRPFLEGRYSIFLPSADASSWRDAGLLVP